MKLIAVMALVVIGATAWLVGQSKAAITSCDNLQQVQESRADSRSFLLWQLGDPEFQPKTKKGEQ